MGGATRYPKGFPGGVEINGVSVLNTYTGKIWYVHSVTGSDNNKGNTWNKPFASINAAFGSGKAQASKGDIVILMPGHVEDISDTSTTGAIDLDVVGVNVIGLGRGSLQPRFDFNHADSDFLIGANDITIQNVHFDATVTGVKLGVAIEAGVTGTHIKDCKFTVETTTTDEFLIAINLLAGCDDTEIEGCFIDMGLGGAATGIKLVGASDSVFIHDNQILGDYSQACIAGITTLSTNVFIERNLLINGNSNALGTVEAIELLTGTLGIIRDNTIFSDVATHALTMVGDTMLYSNNRVSDDSGTGTTTATTSASVVASTDG